MIEIQSGAAITEPVFIQTADDTEYQLIRTAQEAANSGNWIVGECASKWLAAYGKGRTDEAFGEMIGLSKTQVQQRRQVWETFGKTEYRRENLTWTHFREALLWDDAEECLEWADHCAATVKEMILWRKAKRGELQPGKVHSGELSEPKEGRTIHRSVDEPRKQRESKPQSSESKPPVSESKPSKPETTTASQQVQEPPSVRITFAVRELGQAIQALVDAADRRKTAKQLRKLADELDPPTKFVKPDQEEVISYMSTLGDAIGKDITIEAESFFDFYESKGWLVGKVSMKDWRASARKWLREHEANPFGGDGNGRGKNGHQSGHKPVEQRFKPASEIFGKHRKHTE